MGREQLHSWVVQVPGNGYIEERKLYFDANGKRVECQLRVLWNDGTSSTQVVSFLPDERATSLGEVSYPDDTQVSTRFHDDGTWEISHRQAGSDDVKTWRYNSDGSALVKETRPCHDLASHGGVMKIWNVRPDGSPAGDLEMWEELVENADGQHSTVHTKENPDGSWSVTTKVLDASGNLVREDQATHQPSETSPPAPRTTTTRTTPADPGVTAASRTEIFSTSRMPEPSLAMSAGWVGSAPPPVDHITDRWHEYPPGVVTYVGSQVSLDDR